MSDETLPPVKRSDGTLAPRGTKTGQPIDPTSVTLSDFDPVATTTPAAETNPSAGVPTASPFPQLVPSPPIPGDTHANGADATLVAPPAGEKTLGPKSDATIKEPGPGKGIPRGNIDATLAAGPSDVTLGPSPDGVTLIAPAFDVTLGASSQSGGPADATLAGVPSDATLGSGGLDAATRAFHQAAMASAPKAITKGASFGHYELIEPIAKGGMGIVYKARQRSLNRIVALKMILAGQFADQEDINRFYAEAEAAAALSHPNIVAIHEIGEVSGQHFFSMDYIEGQSLSGLIHENPVPPRRAAEFIITIAETMQFAHDSGVVHRDLKPANVLLDKRQRPLITDFGLAKQVSNTSQLTMAGSIVGTPSYMPPEQAAGKIEEVGTWSDLYSIGAILYELLTGRPPFRAASPFETIRQVLETEAPSPRLLNPSVPRDLETICLKCLQKARTNRYASAQELADELKRFLKGEPIHARPISQAARFWRLCQRHPVTSSAIATAAVFFVSASVVMTVAYFQTAAAKARSDQSFRDAMQAVDDLLTTVGEKKLADLPGGQVIQKELLDYALSYNERFLEQRANDPTVANEVARAHFRAGKISMTLGHYNDALTPLTTARKKQEELLAKQPDDAKKLKALGDTITELGQISVRKKDYDTASRDYAEATKIRGRLATSAPNNIEYQRLHANAHMNAAITVFNLAQINPNDSRLEARMGEAQKELEEAQRIRVAALDKDESGLSEEEKKIRKRIRRDLAKGYYNLGDLARVDNRVADAVEEFKKSDAVFDELLKLDPGDLDNQRDAGVCRRLVGDLLVTNNQVAAAREWFQQALGRLETLAKQNPDVAEYQNQQASLWLSLADIEIGEGHDSAAVPALERAKTIYAPLAQRFPDVALYQRELSVTLRELAKVQDATGKAEEADNNFREAIGILETLIERFPNEDDYVFLSNETQRSVANKHMRAGRAILKSARDDSGDGGLDKDRVNQARGQLKRAQEIRLALLSREDDNPKLRPDLGKGYYYQADLERDSNEIPSAIEKYIKAVSVFRELVQEDPEDQEAQSYLAAAQRFTAEMMAKNGQPQDARRCYSEESTRLAELTTNHPAVADYQRYQAYLWKSISSLDKQEGNVAAARDALQRGRTIHCTLMETFPDVAAYRFDLAIALRDLAHAEHAASDEQSAATDLREAIRLLSDLVRQFPDKPEYAEELKTTQAVTLSGTSAPN